MTSYQQQAELARLQHEARLQQAEEARRFAYLRQRPAFHLPAWLHRLGQQVRVWFAAPPTVASDGMAAVRR